MLKQILGKFSRTPKDIDEESVSSSEVTSLGLIVTVDTERLRRTKPFQKHHEEARNLAKTHNIQCIPPLQK